MPSDASITVQTLSKQYRRGAAVKRADSLRDLIAGACRRAFSFKGRDKPDLFWALRDISMDVAQGEVVGIIGQNGAGKSTLLKILSRITTPTSGRAIIRGRLGSLLEVGTGFHPELTGRENICLNGAILGMSRAQIHRKIDEIIDWSGVSAFIDTPVKRYSSGMRVRLAFAVAAHLEPEILIVDEVLAVGDTEFQKKCLGKMSEVAREGRTVLFVSHNMNALLNLCSRAIVLERGRIVFDGAAPAGVTAYTNNIQAPTAGFVNLESAPGRGSGMRPLIKGLGIRVLGKRDYTTRVTTGENLGFDIEYDCGAESVDVAQVAVSTITGQRLFTLGTHLTISAPPELRGRGMITCELLDVPLVSGQYDVSVMLTNRIPWHDVDCVEAALRLEVESLNYFGTGLHPGTEQGPIAQHSRWSVAERELAGAGVAQR